MTIAMSKRADLEDLQEAQEAEQEQADAVTESDMTPMTTRPHQMPGNAEEETKYDPGAGHPAAGEANEPAIEQPEDDEEDMEDEKNTDSGDSSDYTDSDSDSDDGGFGASASLTPIVCHTCTRKFAVNKVKLGMRCVCGSNDLDLDPTNLPSRVAGAIWEEDDRWSYAWGVFDVTQSDPISPAFSQKEQAEEWLAENPQSSTAWVDQFAVMATAKKVALDVDPPNAEIPVPGGAVGDDPMPPIMEPTSSDEPRADELPDNQQFAEPFTDEDAVEAKMALMAREIFKSQNVTPKQSLLIAQKVLASYPLVAYDTYPGQFDFGEDIGGGTFSVPGWEWVSHEDLKVGDVVGRADYTRGQGVKETAVILKPGEKGPDPMLPGQDAWRYWAREENGSREGYLTFGPGGQTLRKKSGKVAYTPTEPGKFQTGRPGKSFAQYRYTDHNGNTKIFDLRQKTDGTVDVAWGFMEGFGGGGTSSLPREITDQAAAIEFIESGQFGGSEMERLA